MIILIYFLRKITWLLLTLFSFLLPRPLLRETTETYVFLFLAMKWRKLFSVWNPSRPLGRMAFSLSFIKNSRINWLGLYSNLLKIVFLIGNFLRASINVLFPRSLKLIIRKLFSNSDPSPFVMCRIKLFLKFLWIDWDLYLIKLWDQIKPAFFRGDRLLIMLLSLKRSSTL